MKFSDLIESPQIQFIGKFEKSGTKYSLWQKGNYWYELTLASQEGRGFKSIDEWHEKSLEEITTDLEKKGYKKL